MSDKLTTRNGETVEIDRVIEALERTPDKAELLQALKSLRQDKVKDALDQTVKAAQFDRFQALEDFLNDGEKAELTQKTYLREVDRFFSWLDRQSIHALQATRADVNRFKADLAGKYSANTVRLTLASCSSLYTYLEAERYLDRSPFAHIKYPRREYKKAIRTDQERTQPVMNEEEYQRIMEAIEHRSNVRGNEIFAIRARDSAKRLLPIVHFMAIYGLRVGDVLTVRVEDEDRFSYREKGGKARQKPLRPVSHSTLECSGMVKSEPFKSIAKTTVQSAIKRVTEGLVVRGLIRHAYSCHDFRHFFAVRLYQDTRDVYLVKEELGHATVSVTEVYLAGLGAIEK